MVSPRTSRWITIAAFALVALMSIGGCSKPAEEPAAPTPARGGTARESLSVAQSALSTMAPDAKLLVVQTAQAVTPTSTPVWGYLFGSPKTDKTYMVYVLDGKSMQAGEYGEAGLGDKEWPKVPELTEWKIDSDVALKNAVAAGAKTGTPTYSMGFQTYVPESSTATQTSKAFMWYVSLDPESKSAGFFEVDAKSGKATASK